MAALFNLEKTSNIKQICHVVGDISFVDEERDWGQNRA